ncbi:MAG: hypothetical protein IPG04_26245 [Polyangiaceae bacterium]|nr:hypothetical protein [Polyangiaceae bacterium]
MSVLVLYRAVFEAERADWRSTGRLRSAPSGMEGKHFTESVDLAARFGRAFRGQGWDAGPFWVLEVSFAEGASVPLHELRQDGIGPSYFADERALESIELVTEVRRIEEDE